MRNARTIFQGCFLTLTLMLTGPLHAQESTAPTATNTPPQSAKDFQFLTAEFYPSADKMLALLKAEKFGEFLGEHVDPEFIQKYKQREDYKLFVGHFGLMQAPTLVERLSNIRNSTAAISNDKSELVYQDDVYRYPLRFRRIDGHWYLFNN